MLFFSCYVARFPRLPEVISFSGVFLNNLYHVTNTLSDVEFSTICFFRKLITNVSNCEIYFFQSGNCFSLLIIHCTLTVHTFFINLSRSCDQRTAILAPETSINRGSIRTNNKYICVFIFYRSFKQIIPCIIFI